jgi:hypothetical protein
VVRAWSTDRVNVSEDIPQQECRFTINGSPGPGGAGAMSAGRSGGMGQPGASLPGKQGGATAGPEVAVQQAWTAILRQNWNDTSAFPVSELAIVLESTGAVGPNPGFLRQVIEQHATPLRNCFAARVEGGFFTFSSGALVCMSTREPFQGVLRVGDSPGVEFVTGDPHLRLAVLAGPIAHYMFLPGLRR